MLNWNQNSAGGTSLRGYLYTPWTFEETVARLKALSKQEPNAGGDGYKVSVEFVGEFNGRVFTIYDYKGDMQLHIGGGDGLNVEALKETLVEALHGVTPEPYSAVIEYDEMAGVRHGFKA